MMQSAFRPDGQVQMSVDPTPMVYESIMARGYPFVAVTRVNVNDPAVDLEHEVQSRCVDQGEPVVLEGFHQQENWKADMFTLPYLQEHFGHEKILCRDLHNADDVSMTMAQYIETVHGNALDADATSESESFAHLGTSIPSNQNSSRARKPLIYAKDLTCPSTWRTFLMNGGLPSFLAYMRENDLNNLNTKLAAENLMVYIGQAGTWTPAHIDQCGAIGHNIMTWADKGSSSVWFMIRSEDKKKAEELWNGFGQPLDYEGYFADLDELQRATFPVYVVEQKIGDFVMVPSQCVHQVINLGKATIKVSWNRLTPNCLKAAMNSVLPKYREVGRPEGYRIKVIITSTLKAWTKKLETQEGDFGMSKDSFSKAFMEVLELYKGIVEEEWVDMHAMGSDSEPFERPKRLKESQHTQPAICDFCRSDIWNRQFQCHQCIDDEDAYDLCARCFSLGRGCDHREDEMEFVENFSMESCRLAYCRAVAAWNRSTALADCPSRDLITDPWSVSIMPSTEKGYSPTTMAYKRHRFVSDAKACHICKSKGRGTLMSVECSSCPLSYCELCLYKYYDALWTDLDGKQAGWKCFRCQGVCPCAQGDRRAATGCAPLESSHKKSLWFTRPEDDHRNQGGVADVLGPSEQDNLAAGEDNWPERPKPAHGSHIAKRAKPRLRRSDDMLDGNDFHRRRSLTPESPAFKRAKRMRSVVDDEDNNEWKARPKPRRGLFAKRSKSRRTYTGDLSDTNDLSDANDSSNYKRNLMTGTQFANLRKSKISHISSRRHTTPEALFSAALGESVDYVRTVAVKAGLSRTLASLSALHLATGLSAYDIFQMDRHCASLDPKIRASYRTDLMEKKNQLPTEDEGMELPEDVASHNRPQEHLLLTAVEEKETPEDATSHRRPQEHQLLTEDEEMGSPEDVISHKRPQKHPKNREVTHVDTAGDGGDFMGLDGEMPEDITSVASEKRQQKRRKTSGKSRKDTQGEDRLPLQPQEEEEEEERAKKERHDDDSGRKQPQKRPKKKEKETHEDVVGDRQDSETLSITGKRQSSLSSQHPSQTRKPTRPKAALRRFSSADASHKQDQVDSSLSTVTVRPRRDRGRASPTVSKPEVKLKASESEKKPTASRRAAGRLKKQTGLSDNTRDIPNHSIVKTPEPTMDTDTEMEKGGGKKEKVKSVLGANRMTEPRRNDDGEDEVLEAGVSHVAVLFESQAEDNSTMHIATNHTSPTSPASPTTPTDIVLRSHSNSKEENALQESATNTSTLDLSTSNAIQTTTKAFKERTSAIEETNPVIEETPSTIKDMTPTVQETTLVVQEERSEIQETTFVPRIQPARPKREQKPRVEEEQTNVITNVVDVSGTIGSNNTANGTGHKKTDDVVSSNIKIVKVTATATTTAPAARTSTTTTTTGNARPIKLVRSSPSHIIVKELVDNSTKIATRMISMGTAAAATAVAAVAAPTVKEQLQSNKTAELPSKPSASSSSILRLVSLMSVSSTDSVVNHPGDATATATSKAGTKGTSTKVEKEGITVKAEELGDRNTNIGGDSNAIKTEEFVGRTRRRMSSRT